MAVLCVSGFGFAPDFATLLTLQCLASAGIGAFHPPAAAAAGRLSGRKRSLGVAAFFIAGMMGGVCGNIGAPHYVGAFTPTDGGVERIGVGLRAMIWWLIPGMIAVLALGWAIHNVPHRHHGAHDHHTSLPPEERKRRWHAVRLLYVASIIRFTVNNALVALYVIWAEQLTLARADATALTEALALQASQINGLLQGAMQIGMGGAGLAFGFLLRAKHEKPALVLVPAVGSIAVFVAPYADRSPTLIVLIAFLLAVATGVGFGSLVPVSISVAQRLIPHRSSLASGLMMGGAWCFAAAGPYIATAWYTAYGLDRAFHLTAGMLLVAAIVGALIPARTIRDSDMGA
jgi:MFS family permease